MIRPALSNILTVALLGFTLCAPIARAVASEIAHQAQHDNVDFHSHPESGQSHSHEHQGYHGHGESGPEGFPLFRLGLVRPAPHEFRTEAFSPLKGAVPAADMVSRLRFESPPRPTELLLASIPLNKAPPVLLF